MRYRGDGVYPDGSTPETRGEKGRYLADPQLVAAVNTALIVEQPLLVTGEPGTGKTTLAWSVASELGLGPVLELPHPQRSPGARRALRDRPPAALLPRADPATRGRRSPSCTSAGTRSARRFDRRRAGVVLIDEIDKAPRDFPNDLLDEIDQMEFRVPELGHAVQGDRSGRW